MSVKSIIRFLIGVPIKMISCLSHGQQIGEYYINHLIEEYDCVGNQYSSLWRRPKSSAQIRPEKENDIQNRIAIILQGPLAIEENFTLETVKMYRKLYPGTALIISTWAGENEQMLRKLSQIDGCYLVISDPPEHSGILNLNYQIVSTMAGIRKAQQLGKEYVFKTRCDYRFARIGLMEYLVNLCTRFPVDESIKYQKCRIVCAGGLWDSMFRAYWLDDRYCFGNIDDMLAYWNYDLDSVDWPRETVSRILQQTCPSWKKRTEERLGAEPNIVRNYIKRMETGMEPECTVKTYWEVLKKQFITLAPGEIDGFWFKYTRWNESVAQGKWYREDSTKRCLCYNWDFAKWLSLYVGTLVYEDRFECYQEEASATIV